MRRWTFVITLGALILFPLVSAQAYTVGNPAGGTGAAKLAVSAEYEYQERRLPDELSTQSTRYLVKASYGLTSWLDVFAKGGAANLEIPMADVRFVGEDKFAWGGGARATLLELPVWRTEIFTSAQIFSYRTRGRIEQAVTSSPEVWTRRLDSKYLWWEYGGATGIRLRQGAVWPYLGLDISYVEGEKTTHQYNIFSYGAVDGGESGTEFSSADPVLNLFAGIDMTLPLRYKLSCEIRGSSREEISFTIGFSQRSP